MPVDALNCGHSDAAQRQERSLVHEQIRRAEMSTWVEPEFLADVEHRDITAEGLLRAATFKACRGKISRHVVLQFAMRIWKVGPTVGLRWGLVRWKLRLIA